MRAIIAVVCVLVLGGCGKGAWEAKEDADDTRGTSACIARSSQALTVCPSRDSVLQGVDISAWQGEVNWAAVQGDGMTFAFARVSDGLSYPDKYFEQNWKAMKAAGLVRGVYQFFRPGADPIAQAQLMLDKLEAAGGLEDTDLPPVLDLEDDDGYSASEYQKGALAWIKYVEEQTGRRPIVYSAAFFSPFTGNAFSNYPLWVANYKANYTSSCPVMPDGWTKWAFWQWTDKDSVAGVEGGVDGNIFDGSRADLDAFIRASHLTAPETPDAGAPDEADAGSEPSDPDSEPERPTKPADRTDSDASTDGQGSAMGAGTECDENTAPGTTQDENVDAGGADAMIADASDCPAPAEPATLLPDDKEHYCKDGFVYDSASDLCIDEELALGPFTPQMVETCKRCGGEHCDDANWPVEQARSLRGTDACMPGTSDVDGLCVDETEAYGPFAPELVASCLSQGGGEVACRSMRWARPFAETLNGNLVPGEATGERAWTYILPDNYGVRDDALGAGEFSAARSGNAGGHSGIDFLAPVGTALLAPCEGDAVSGVAGGYGSYVQLVCPIPSALAGGDTLWASIFFAHLSQIDIGGSQHVSRGLKVGEVGKTGNAAAAGINAHVHFEIAIHGSESDAFSESHASSNHSGNAASTLFAARFEQACLTPYAFSSRTGPTMKGRRPDPFMLLACIAGDRPAVSPPPRSLQDHTVLWSTHYAASFDVDDAS